MSTVSLGKAQTKPATSHRHLHTILPVPKYQHHKDFISITKTVFHPGNIANIPGAFFYGSQYFYRHAIRQTYPALLQFYNQPGCYKS